MIFENLQKFDFSLVFTFVTLPLSCFDLELMKEREYFHNAGILVDLDS